MEATEKMSKSIHQFTAKDLRGKDVSLADYKDKVLLVVNTASECGYTGQLEDMEKLYQKYKAKGFEVLAFPSNDFGDQEPLKGEKIETFCQVNYGVSFKIFDKVSVKGKEANEIFKFLSKKKLNGNVNSSPKWNFHKYLVNKEGEVVDYFLTFTKPDSNKIQRAIEELL